MQTDNINDKEISNLFEDAKDKIDKVEGQATEQKRRLKDIVFIELNNLSRETVIIYFSI